MPAGRPTDYKPEFCELLIEHMGEGFSFEAFAGVVNCNRDTLYEWANVHPEFSDAKKIGFERNRLTWERIGIDLARKGDGNATAFIFNMKNRFPKEWRDKIETGFTDGEGKDIKPVQVIQLPDNGRNRADKET